ncbi:MAG: tRNA uridine-5-carboxymethylaminomethyl(34) synthesis GTPase MnmE [Clostridia bacterium]
MANINSTSIAAISTAKGLGGIAVIRISGNKAREIADKVFKGSKKISELPSYTASYGKVYDSQKNLIDEVVALNFIAPKSFTGEDVVEISCHGGTYTSQRVLDAVIQAGASHAMQGEFTKRAFLNGKIDLSQAEAISELISATSQRTHEAAMSVKEGKLSKNIDKILEKLVDIGGDLSAWADYPDDDVPQVDETKLICQLSEINENLDKMIRDFDSGKIYRDGINTVIAGRPNAGKSTLMNMLSGCERSIVTEIAGTTRDVVEERVMLGDIPLILADTAGIRSTDDPVEKIGVKLAKDRLGSAELVLAVFDSSQELQKDDLELIELCQNRPTIAIINKNDLCPKIDNDYISKNIEHRLFISAKSGIGLDELKELLEKMLGLGKVQTGSAELCTDRQKEAVTRAKTATEQAHNDLENGLTLDAVTVLVEESISALLELKGEKVSEALVNNVFSRFCVGK